jgi:hypothetical protein
VPGDGECAHSEWGEYRDGSRLAIVAGLVDPAATGYGDGGLHRSVDRSLTIRSQRLAGFLRHVLPASFGTRLTRSRPTCSLSDYHRQTLYIWSDGAPQQQD